MIEGQITADLLVEVFRTISQRKRQGKLEMAFNGINMELVFSDGKIIEARQVEEAPDDAICDRLHEAGYLLKEIIGRASEIENTSRELYAMLVEQQHTEEKNVLLAKAAYEMDLLHELRWFEEGYINFNTELVDVDSFHVLDVAPGQLILDLVILDSDEDRFRDVFDNTSPDDLIYSVGEPYQKLSSFEKLILENIGDGLTLNQLRSNLLLSEYHLREALLSLYDLDLLDVGVKPAEQLGDDEDDREQFQSSVLQRIIEDEESEAEENKEENKEEKKEEKSTSSEKIQKESDLDLELPKEESLADLDKLIQEADSLLGSSELAGEASLALGEVEEGLLHSGDFTALVEEVEEDEYEEDFDLSTLSESLDSRLNEEVDGELESIVKKDPDELAGTEEVKQIDKIAQELQNEIEETLSNPAFDNKLETFPSNVEGSKNIDDKPRAEVNTSFGDRLININLYLSRDDILLNAISLVVITFLMFSALFAPAFISSWFDALSNFSSY